MCGDSPWAERPQRTLKEASGLAGALKEVAKSVKIHHPGVISLF